MKPLLLLCFRVIYSMTKKHMEVQNNESIVWKKGFKLKGA